MTWRDELRPASFRGVPFFVEQATTRQGLHADEQVFPGRSTPGDAVHVEHLGTGPRRFQVDAFVVGDDYHERRDALEAALLEQGSGRLVHPYRGEHVVSVVGDVSTVEARKRGGYARITFTVVVTESPTLRRAPDTEAIVERDLDIFLDDLARDFGEGYEADAAVPDAFAASAEDAFSSAVGTLGPVYSSVLAGVGAASDFAGDVEAFAGDLERFASAPLAAVRSLIGALGRIATVPERLLSTAMADHGGAIVSSMMSAFGPLLRFGEELVTIAGTTPNRAAEQRMRDAVVQAVRGAAAGQLARAVASLPYDSRTQAIEVRDALVDALGRLVEEGSAGGDTESGARLYDAIAAARAAIVAHLSAIARTLPELARYEVSVPLPALVIAHELYGDARRAEEIVERNDPPTPGWIPIGTVLEVLRHG